MKTALIALVLTTIAPSHVTFAVLGLVVSMPAAALILAAEVLAAASGIWLTARVLCRFRSSPWLRPAFPGGQR